MLKRLSRLLDELGLRSPPPDDPEATRILRIFMLCGVGFELLGPIADLLLHLNDPSHGAFHRTSLWNLGFAAAFLLAWLLLQRGLPPQPVVRVIVFGGIIGGIPALHHLGGALGPAAWYLSIPVALGLFFLPWAEAFAGLALAATGWVLLVGIERRVLPPPALDQDPELYAIAYLSTALAGLAFLLTLMFGVHRRVRADLLRTRARLEEALGDSRRQADELAQALRARESFLTMASHELRTPLAGIVGLAEVANRDLDRIEPAHLRSIHAASVHLLRVVENMLDMTRSQSGSLEPRPSVADLPRIVEQTLDFSRSLCPPELVLASDIEAMPPDLVLDGEKVRRILANLLANAIRATPAGRVDVRVRIRGNEVEIEVEDSGRGFEPAGAYRPADASPAGWIGEGMGLGLRIVRTLVATLDGAFEIHSQPRQGTRARVRIPFRCGAELAAGALPEPVPAPDPLPGRPRLLVIDDHAELREVFRLYGETAGWEVLAAASPEEGLAWLQTHRCDLVLMDLRMPETSGQEGLRLIRARWGDAAPPVVALTAHVAGDDERSLRQEGFDGFIPKPVAYAVFVNQVERLLRPVSVDPGEGASEAGSDPEVDA